MEATEFDSSESGALDEPAVDIPDEDGVALGQDAALEEFQRLHDEGVGAEPSLTTEEPEESSVASFGGGFPSADTYFASSFGDGDTEKSGSAGFSESYEEEAEVTTLEDLYSAFPKVGDGSHYLRVIRKSPATWNGVRIAGWVSDIGEQLSLSEFAARLGGGVYEISVRGPSRGGLGPDGTVPTRTLKTIRLEVTGKPAAVADNQQGASSMGLYGRQDDDTRFKIKELEIQAQERAEQRKREDQLRRDVGIGKNGGDGSLDPKMFQLFEQTADKRARQTQEIAQEVVNSLKDDRDRLKRALEQKEQDIDALRTRLVDLQTETTLRLREEESRQVRELKDSHESEMRRIKDDGASTVQRISSENQRIVNEMSERFGRDRDALQRNEQGERDRLRTDSERRERQLVEDSKLREQTLRDSYESRLSEQQRSLEREVSGIKDQRDREIVSVQANESNRAVLSEKTAEIQVGTAMAEVNRLTSQLEARENEVARLRGEMDEFRRAQVKDPLSAIQEAQTLVGLVSGPDSGPKDWKDRAVDALGEVFRQVPDVLRSVSDTRASNQQARDMHKANASQARAEHLAQRRLPSMGGAPPQQQRRQERAFQSPPAPPAPPAPLAPMSAAPPPQSMPPLTQVDDRQPNAGDFDLEAPPEFPSEADIIGDQYTPVDEPSPAPPAPPVSDGGYTETVAVEASADGRVAEAPPEMEIDPEVIGAFVQKLDMAIGSGLATPEAFADGAIAEVGESGVRKILSTISADQLVDTVAAQVGSENSAMVTREGRTFVRDLWASASAKVDS
jgi:hypothetical protein